MRQIQRFVALLLCGIFLIPAWLQNSAEGLETPNVTKESYTFYQRGTDRVLNTYEQEAVDSDGNFRSSYQSKSFVREQAADSNISWAIAAIAALDAAYGKETGLYTSTFSDTHMIFSTSSDSGNSLGFARAFNAAGNRNMATAYIMRGTLGGPVTGFPSYPGASSILPQNLVINEDNGERHFVSGVTYIPEPQTTGGQTAKDLFIKRIKDAVYASGAVAASLYMDVNCFYDGQQIDEYQSDTKRDIYHYPYRVTADHSVAIVGWDDTGWKYDVPTPTTDEPDKTTLAEHTGAFLVRDSMIDGGIEYWVSYETILSGVYYIEGFLDESETEGYEYTYEYDIFGFNSAMGFSGGSALYANVFTVAGAADSMEAVSTFFTGENTTVRMYYVPDYKSTDDLKDISTKGIEILAPTTKTLPGYYCFPITPITLGAQGTKYAIVAVAENPYGTSPIPVQTIASSAGTGRSFISAKGNTWTDSYAQGQATVCIKAHVRQNVDIPLEKITIASTKDPETDEIYREDGGSFGTLDSLRVAPGLSYTLGPVYAPLNANDVAKSSTVWRFYDSDGKHLVTVDKDSDETVRIEVPTEYEKDEEKPSVPTFRFKTGQLTMPADIMTGRYIVTAEVYIFESDEDEDENEEDRELQATPFTAQGMVDIRAVAVESITLDKSEVSLKAGGTATVKATITPDDTSYKTVTWKVAAAYEKIGDTYTYTPYPQGYDAGDPYHPDGPIATVSDKGKVTALRDGECYVYAEIVQGDSGIAVRSAPYKVTIAKNDPTGITVAKKKMEMSLDTKYTLKATVKPSAASNKRVSWSSSDHNVVSVDPILGILEAKSVGTATITATNSLGATAECVITVTAAPSNTVNLKKSTTLSLTGAATSDTVVWEITQEDLDYNVEEPLNNSYFTAASASKTKLKLTADEVGDITVRAYVSAKTYDENGEETDERPILEQTWQVSAVVALNKLAMENEQDETVTRITVCVDPSGKRAAQVMTLNAVVVKPTDATLLDFTWQSAKPSVAEVEPASGENPNNAIINVKAVSVGATKITGTNYNSNKKVTLTVKVMAYPDSVAFKKSGPISLAPGKSVSLKAYASGVKGINKEIAYSLEDEEGNKLADNNGIATLGKNGKVKAVGVGTVYLVARAAPYNADGVSTRIKLICKVPVKKVTVSTGRSMSVGDTMPLNISLNPSNATVKDVTISTVGQKFIEINQDAQGNYSVTAKAAGSVKLTISSVDDPKKKKTVTIRIS